LMFSDDSVRYSEKGGGSEGGRRDRKTAISDNVFEKINHIQE